MPRKRDTPPEQLLQRVITGLEAEARPKYYGAILALLAEGPLLCSEALRQAIEARPDPPLDQQAWRAEILAWRAELLQFLRTLVRDEGLDSTEAAIGTAGSIVFTGYHAGGRVQMAAEAPHVRDLVVLQLVLLVQAVGLGNIRRCGADCVHLFVRTYRKEFCSIRCQSRHYKRQLRQQQRDNQIRARQRRRITKGQR